MLKPNKPPTLFEQLQQHQRRMLELSQRQHELLCERDVVRNRIADRTAVLTFAKLGIPLERA